MGHQILCHRVGKKTSRHNWRIGDSTATPESELSRMRIEAAWDKHGYGSPLVQPDHSIASWNLLLSATFSLIHPLSDNTGVTARFSWYILSNESSHKFNASGWIKPDWAAISENNTIKSDSFTSHARSRGSRQGKVSFKPMISHNRSSSEAVSKREVIWLFTRKKKRKGKRKKRNSLLLSLWWENRLAICDHVRTSEPARIYGVCPP